MTDWQPAAEAPRDQPLRLLCQGKQRLGQWDNARQAWYSVIDPRVRLVPSHYMPLPRDPHPPTR